MENIANLARQSRASVAARATEAPAQAPADSPYEDATEPQPIPGTRKVALIVRDKRSGALYACSRGASGTGAKRVHLDALSVLGFVHVGDAETLAEAGYVPAPEDKPKTSKARGSK